MFRDDKGRYGLIGRSCPHRGTDLAYGRLENGGLRCAFHGWLFDVAGQCLETPAEPDGSNLCANIRQKAYPVVEKNGILFAYLGPGEPPEFPHFDCFVAPGQPHLRVQGHDRLQLAAVAGGRHRSGAHLVPAPLLPRRGPEGGLRQGVPRHLDRFGNADDEDHARVSAPAHRGRADRFRLPAVHAAEDQRQEHPRPRHQPDVPQRLRHSDEPGDDDHAVARADRRHQALLVRDLHQLRRAGEQGRDAAPAPADVRIAGLHPAPATRATTTASIRTSRRTRPLPAWASTSTCTTSGPASRWARSRTAPPSISASPTRRSAPTAGCCGRRSRTAARAAGR